jgi:hypothetical protein
MTEPREPAGGPDSTPQAGATQDRVPEAKPEVIRDLDVPNDDSGDVRGGFYYAGSISH